MAKKKDIYVNLFNGEDLEVPFVKVEYLDQDAKEHAALLMIDSGSDVNVVFKNKLDSLCYKEVKNEHKHMLNGLGGDAKEVEDVELNFTLSTLMCHETFCVSDVVYPLQLEYPVIGLLGNLFLSKYNLALDYGDLTIHTSKVTPENLDANDCDYFFHMELGRKNYHLPVVFMKLNEKKIVAIADSGSTDNMVAAKSLADSHVLFDYLGDGDTMYGATGEVKTKLGRIPFSLVSATADGEKELKKVAIFKIPLDYIWSPQLVDEDGDKLPPIEAVLCSSFMASQGWVLDFGEQIIYKRRSSFLLHVNESEQKNHDDRHLRFYSDSSKVGMPLIQITEGDFKGMVLLVDSGSSGNVIFEKAYREMQDNFSKKDESNRLMGLEGNPVEVETVYTKVCIQGRNYPMRFLVSNNNHTVELLKKNLGVSVAGIIGTLFMSEHDWTLDFGKQEVIFPIADIVDPEQLSKKEDE